MIIDLILDRKDGTPYRPTDFTRRLTEYGETWPEMTAPILDAFQHGTNGTIKAALCQYVIAQGYSPAICDYICSVKWAPGLAAGDVYENFGVLWVVDRIYKVDPETSKAYELYYNTRIHSHVISAYPGYQGMRECDSAYTPEMASHFYPDCSGRN